MTATVHVVQSLFRPHLRENFVAEHSPGETIRAVAARFVDPAWGEDPDVAVLLNGKRLAEADVDATIEDGADLVVMPEVAGIEAAAIFVGNAILTAIIATGISFAINALLGRPKPPIPRGDTESAAHTWDGIRTNWAAGWRIPIVYGIHRCGGQVIASSLYEMGIDDVLVLHLVLSEGPIARIGGIDLTSTPDINGLGNLKPRARLAPFPVGIRVNGSDLGPEDTWVHLRAGTLYQTPVPGPGRATTIQAVSKPLRQGNPQFTDTGVGVSSVHVRVRFDALYEQTGGGPIEKEVEFDGTVLNPANGSLITGPFRFRVKQNTRNPFHVSFTLAMPTDRVPASGTFRIGFIRQTPDDGPNSVSSCTWSELVERIPDTDLAFPGCAQMAIEIRASEAIAGSQPNVTVPIWGLLVRWKDAGVWQEPAFQHVASGRWPGRNPAWVAYDFLTKKYGLGKWFSASMIDEVSLEKWANYCDQLVSDGTPTGQHPRHQFDDVIDRGESGWDVLLAICRAGRCIPWPFADKVTFKFEHPDQPGLGLPRPFIQCFAESNIEDLQITYKDRRSRPNIYDAQILDESLQWERNVISQEDPDAFGLNEPWKVGAEQPRREMIEFTGITRAAHARRELLWMHAVNRLSYSEVEFTVAIDAFPVEIGDIIAIQHDVPRFFDTATGGFRTTRAGAATTNIYLDHAVTLAGGRSYEFMVVRSDTTPVLVAITAGAGTYPVDTAIAVASAQTYNKGAVIAFGDVGKSVRQYQVVNLEFAEELKFRVTAVLYDGAAFDLETVTALGEDSGLASTAVVEMASVPAVLDAPQILVAANGAGAAVSWTYPPDRRRVPARVYIRPKVAPAPDPTFELSTDQRWELVYEGQGTEVTV